MADLTRILQAVEQGEEHSSQRLLPLVYEELRRLASDLNRELALLIRAGDIPEGTLAHLLATVADKLRIASPRYLERYC